MSPFQYVHLYHNLVVHDPRLGIHCSANITRYISGMPDDNREEYGEILRQIAIRHLKLKYTKHIPTWFSIPNSDLVDPYEEFSKPGLRRALGGRASPDEYRDALRLARLVDRCTGDGAMTYAQKWFGLDCNAFVGNYQGISPSSSITSYVHGYGQGKLKGATEDVYMTRDLLPLPPITKEDDIRPGTVLVTFRPDKITKYGDHWGHIALVESFGPGSSASKRSIKIVEWGQKGSIAAHVDGAKEVTLLHEDLSKTIKAFKGKDVFAFWDKNGKDLRIFLDASGWNHIAHRGWNIGTSYET
jgi:hypothetical protein